MEGISAVLVDSGVDHLSGNKDDDCRRDADGRCTDHHRDTRDLVAQAVQQYPCGKNTADERRPKNRVDLLILKDGRELDLFTVKIGRGNTEIDRKGKDTADHRGELYTVDVHEHPERHVDQ